MVNKRGKMPLNVGSILPQAEVSEGRNKEPNCAAMSVFLTRATVRPAPSPS